MLRKWIEGEKLVLNKNPFYFEWADSVRLPFLDGISVTFLRSRETAFLELLQGKIDFMSGLDDSFRDEIMTADGVLAPHYHGRFQMVRGPYLNTEYLGFFVDRNSIHPDRWVRKAISASIDRDRLLQYLRKGIGLPGHYGIIPPSLIAEPMRPPDGTKFNRDQANAYLAKAGYSSAREVEPITLFTDNAYVDIGTAIVHQLSEAGFKIKLEVMDRPTLRSQIAKGRLGFFRASWIADYADAENYLALFSSHNHAPAGPNYTHFHNPEFDKLYLESQSEQDDYERTRIYLKMDSLVMAEAPVIILYYDEVIRLVRNEVMGLKINVLNYLDLRRVRKNQTEI